MLLSCKITNFSDGLKKYDYSLFCKNGIIVSKLGILFKYHKIIPKIAIKDDAP